ncbi:MAG: Flp family type IVb pilin [Pseudomonadota bacterium]
MFQTFESFARDERGATAIEYGLIVTLVGVAAVIAFETLGQTISDALIQVSAALQSAVR